MAARIERLSAAERAAQPEALAATRLGADTWASECSQGRVSRRWPPTSPHRRRDAALIALLVGAGRGAREAAALDLADLDRGARRWW